MASKLCGVDATIMVFVYCIVLYKVFVRLLMHTALVISKLGQTRRKIRTKAAQYSEE